MKKWLTRTLRTQTRWGIVALALCFSTATALAIPTGTFSSIGSNFNGTNISGNSFIWFNSVLDTSGLGSNPVTIFMHDATITFSANSVNYNLSVPDAKVIYNPSTGLSTSTFNSGEWDTNTKPGLSGNTFLSGLVFDVPASGIPGGTNPVTWSGFFETDTPGVTLNWKWAAAVYTALPSDNNALGVKPVDANNASIYLNSDHAGTPENFKDFVVGGARGGGGSNFTGSYSGTESVAPVTFQPPVIPEPATFSLIALGLSILGLKRNGKRRQISA